MTSQLQNADVFARDPRKFDIPNSGVTKLSTPTTSAQWSVLKWELESFVCEGQYERGIERLLRTYLQRADDADQPGWWISGFYGSGKSHMVRVLEHIWADTKFPDGSSARSLVNLPTSITDLLRELDAVGRREGGLWSASGTLGAQAEGVVRLAFASILFTAAGLPSQYQQARLVMWLRQKGVLDKVRDAVNSSSETWEFALENLYVSFPLAAAVKEAVPGFASESEVRELFKEQFRKPTDLSDDELLTVAEEVMSLQSSKPGKLPCTLVVLDEVQQFITSGADRHIDQVARLAESVTSRFGGKLLLVATGQSAMGATPQLSKIKDRFPMAVELSSTDVEEVVRKVLLRKNPEHAVTLSHLLEQASGEINRHLQDSPRLKRQLTDDAKLSADYPLLPSRRRLWEEFLRVIDQAGGSSQLRSQLRIIHEANREVASHPLGHMVGADFVYRALEGPMQNTSALSPELAAQIKKLAVNHGVLAERIAQLLFIISRLDPALGVKATEGVLADLLVENLVEGSSNLRAQLPAVLSSLVESGQIMQHDNEYRLQTREGAEWEGDFRSAYNRLFGDDVAQLQKREEILKKTVEAQFKRDLTFTQGESKTARKAEIYYASPPSDTTTVPIWVRKGWDEGLQDVRKDALAVGTDSPLVYVYLPEPDRQALKTQIATLLATSEVLGQRPNPTTRGAQEAQQGMQTRQRNAQLEVERLIGQMVDGARVLQGGGQELEGQLHEALPKALHAAASRLYPQFKAGDSAKWGTVLTHAKQGNQSALDAVSHSGEPIKHPVLQTILSQIGAGKKGNEVRKTFTGTPYGWPQDAVDSALVLLTLLGNLTASVNGSEVAAKALDAITLIRADFRTVNEPLTRGQLLGIRSVFTDMKMKVESGEEAAHASNYAARLREKVQASGGEAPLPERLEPGPLAHLQGLGGQELLRQIYEHRDTLKTLNQQADARIALIAKRIDHWDKLQRLLKHNSDPTLQAQAEAIVTNRLLLAEPDPTVPLANDVMNSLRERLNAAREHYTARLEVGMQEVKAMPQWAEYPADQQASIFSKYGLQALDKPRVSKIEEIIATLENRNLTGWADATEAIAGRIQRVKDEVIAQTQPKALTIRPKGATLNNAAEAEAYLESLKQEIMQAITEGKPVIVSS